MDTKGEKVRGHYVLPLPFINEKVYLNNNKQLALKRLLHHKRKFAKITKFHGDYKEFIDNMISKGHARKVQHSYNGNEKWFIPHHGRYDQKKKKIRVVFDCSSKYQGRSDELLQGLDLANQLLGVLIRFRQHSIATMGDIESMF